jgi:hypothetical protein
VPNTDEFISADEVSVAKRGRTKVIDTALADTLKKLKAGQAVRLGKTFGEVPKDKRAGVSQTIRKHWKHVRPDDCRVDYGESGIPQVRVKAEA